MIFVIKEICKRAYFVNLSDIDSASKKIIKKKKIRSLWYYIHKDANVDNVDVCNVMVNGLLDMEVYVTRNLLMDDFIYVKNVKRDIEDCDVIQGS